MSKPFTDPSAILAALRTIVGNDGVLTGADAEPLAHDRSSVTPQSPLAVVLPRTTTQVQQLVLLANTHGLALVPSGGRTGLCGGASSCQGDIVVSLARMNRILDFSDTDASIRCEAGVITAQVQDYARERGLFYPVDFASSGSSQIGGNVATNAGGIGVIRYGMTRRWISGLTVVTGKGDILVLNRGLKKNNTGYDLMQLFIGAEGTLGIICEVTVMLTRTPQHSTVLLMPVAELLRIPTLLAAVNRITAPSAFEFFCAHALDAVCEKTGMAKPFAQAAPYYALVELDSAVMAEEVFAQLQAQGLVQDGIISSSERQSRELWRYRESISESITPRGPWKQDIAVRVQDIPAFVIQAGELLSTAFPGSIILWFGHIGDGNLHINVVPASGDARDTFIQRCRAAEQPLFNLLRDFGGSVSAEHGIGQLKRDWLPYSRTPDELAYMQGIKQVFDPQGVLNPRKIFDAVSEKKP